MANDPLLDHLEKTFADAYRKEIDQEENVWRSLPFFAAALALELAAFLQVRDLVLGTGGLTFAGAVALLGIAGGATLAAVVLLALSVWPAAFRYVAREPAFREYAENVRAEALASAGPDGSDPDPAEEALRTVKAALAEQYATAADHNRRINQGRARWRTLAGLATLTSILAVLALVALAVISDMRGHARSPAPPRSNAPATAPDGNPRPALPEQRSPAPDGGRSQGLVPRYGDGAPGGGLAGGRP